MRPLDPKSLAFCQRADPDRPPSRSIFFQADTPLRSGSIFNSANSRTSLPILYLRGPHYKSLGDRRTLLALLNRMLPKKLAALAM
jgi:hypothetical protein